MSKPTILLVDDQDAIRHMLSQLLNIPASDLSYQRQYYEHLSA